MNFSSHFGLFQNIQNGFRCLFLFLSLSHGSNQRLDVAITVSLIPKQNDSHRGHPDLNRRPLDLQSNALPLSYTPTFILITHY